MVATLTALFLDASLFPTSGQEIPAHGDNPIPPRTRKYGIFNRSARKHAIKACSRAESEALKQAEQVASNTTVPSKLAPPPDEAAALAADDVARVLKCRQRAQVAASFASVDSASAQMDLFSSRSSSPVGEGPSTPTEISHPLPYYLSFPAGRARRSSSIYSDSSSEWTPSLASAPPSPSKRKLYRNDSHGYPREKCTQPLPSPSRSSRPPRSKASLWRQTVTRPSTPRTPSLCSSFSSSSIESMSTPDILALTKLLPPLPRFDPYRRARAESLSSISVPGQRIACTGSSAVSPSTNRRRCQSLSSVGMEQKASRTPRHGFIF